MMWIYAIIVIVVLGLYSASITLRYLSIRSKYHQQKIHRSLHDVVNEIITMMTFKEDNEVDKGAYKNTRASEYVQVELTSKAPTLTSLLATTPTEKNYEDILDMLIDLFKQTYNEYKFYIAKSSDETKAANFMQVTSPQHENPELHKAIFKLAVDSNMDMLTLQKKFAQKAAEGKVVDLGDNAVVVLNDNTPQLPTAVSPLQSGLEGSEISFIISFLRADNFDAWYANTFPEVAKDGE